jgi:hypothetical protein
MEYEFTVVFDVAMDHHFHVSKDRTGLFDSRIEKMTPKHGEELISWLSGAAAVEPKQEQPKAETTKFTRPAPKQAEVSVADAGDYRVQIGKRFYGKRLADVPMQDLIGFVEWLEDTTRKDYSPPDDRALAFIAAVERYHAAVNSIKAG